MKTVAIEQTGMNEATPSQLRMMPQVRAPKRGSFTSDVYRLHSFRVLDAEGKKVGIVDWIWTDEESNQGEFLGVHLHWLRGTTRAIPTVGAEIDHENMTIEVAHTAAQIRRAQRFKIDRALTAREKRRICFHYALEPATVPSLMPEQRLAA